MHSKLVKEDCLCKQHQQVGHQNDVRTEDIFKPVFVLSYFEGFGVPKVFSGKDPFFTILTIFNKFLEF